MLYRKEGNIYSRAAAINAVLTELGSVVQPSYIDDETLALYGFEIVPSEKPDNPQKIGKEGRKKALASLDWVSGAKHLTKQTKDAVEAWRSVVRDCPDCTILPPVPELIAIKSKKASVLNEDEIVKIRNYATKDAGWVLFLQTWKDLGFPDSKNIVANLILAYTKVTLDEIIGSI